MAIMDGKEEHIEDIPKEAIKIDVTHVTGTSGMTHIGQVFTPEQLRRVTKSPRDRKVERKH